MDNSIIKIMLSNRKPRVYSLIVQMYFDKIELYKASVFKIWLAKELDIPSDQIHESSISAALARHKKRQATQTKPERLQAPPEKTPLAKDFNTDIPDEFPGFK